MITNKSSGILTLLQWLSFLTAGVLTPAVSLLFECLVPDSMKLENGLALAITFTRN